MEQADVARTRYTRVAVVLHWAIAVMILFNLSLGFFMEGMQPPWRGRIISLHISAGMTVLALTVARVLWRLTHKPPPYPSQMQPWKRHTANIVHFLLYAGMVAMPLTGWALISSNPPPGSPGAVAAAKAQAAAQAADPAGSHRPPPRRRGAPRLWWTLPMPMISTFQQIGATPEGLAPQKVVHDDFVELHKFGGIAMIVLLLLHVGAALAHQFIGRQNELARMSLARRRRTAP